MKCPNGKRIRQTFPTGKTLPVGGRDPNLLDMLLTRDWIWRNDRWILWGSSHGQIVKFWRLIWSDKE